MGEAKRRKALDPNWGKAKATVLGGHVAHALFGQLGRGALVWRSGELPFYWPQDRLRGEGLSTVAALVSAYNPQSEWVVLDASCEITAAANLPIDHPGLLFNAPEGTTAEQFAQDLVKINDRIAVSAFADWGILS